MLKLMQIEIDKIAALSKTVSWEDEDVYAAWLSQAHAIVLRSVPLLGLAHGHSIQYPEFHQRCLDHIREEKGHEKLIENDLKQLGTALKPELLSTMLIYQPQYFQIVQNSPIAFLGYVFFLELLAPICGQHVIERVGNKKAVSFLKVHINEDEDHLKSAAAVLEGLPPELKEAVWQNFKMTATAYTLMLNEISRLGRAQQPAA